MKILQKPRKDRTEWLKLTKITSPITYSFLWETMKSTLEHYVKNDSASVDIQSCYLQFSGT